MIYLASLTEETKDKVEGFYMVKTKEALDKIVADNTEVNRVIIRPDFAQEYFTPSGLNAFIQNAKRLNRNLLIELDGTYSQLTSDRFVEMVAKARNMEEMLTLLTTYPKEYMDTMKQLTGKYLDKQRELLQASNNVSRLQSIIDEQAKKIENLNDSLQTERDNKYNSQCKLDALVKRINYQYNMNVNASKLFQVDSNSYDKILYIKEVTRVQYMDTLIYYLKEILKVLYNMPTRLLVVEGYYAYGRDRLYPGLVPHYGLSERDVIANDIVMFGMQPNLMTDILKNPSNISILIVLDRGGHLVPHIKGDNVEYLYAVSDVNDLSDEIPNSRIISYSEDTLYIPYIRDFNKFDKSGKMTKYSSLDIVKKLIKLIEGR